MSVPYKFTLRKKCNPSSTKVYWQDCFHPRKERERRYTKHHNMVSRTWVLKKMYFNTTSL